MPSQHIEEQPESRSAAPSQPTWTATSRRDLRDQQFGRGADWRGTYEAVSPSTRRDFAHTAVVSSGVLFLLLIVINLFLRFTPTLPMVLLWIMFSVFAAVTHIRHNLPGLFRFRLTDVLWGVTAGVALRVLQGALSGANELPFPSIPPSQSWWGLYLPSELIVGPVLEELFFRGALLATLFVVLRGMMGVTAAGVTSSLLCALIFVIVHAASAGIGGVEAIQLFVIGQLLALLVLSTGRIWPAITAHMTYNASWAALVVAGSLLR